MFLYDNNLCSHSNFVGIIICEARLNCLSILFYNLGSLSVLFLINNIWEGTSLFFVNNSAYDNRLLYDRNAEFYSSFDMVVMEIWSWILTLLSKILIHLESFFGIYSKDNVPKGGSGLFCRY